VGLPFGRPFPIQDGFSAALEPNRGPVQRTVALRHVVSTRPPWEAKEAVHPSARASLVLCSAALAGGLLLTGVEWWILPGEEVRRLGTADRLLLPLLMGSAWFLRVLVVALVLEAVHLLSRKLAGRRVLFMRVGVALLSLLLVVYGAHLARYTFSGRVAAALWYRPIALVLLPLLIAGVLSAPFVLNALRERRWVRVLAPIGCGAVAVAALLTNHLVLPEEYEPLHTFLSLAALAHAAAAGTLLAARVRTEIRPRFGHGVLAASVFAAVGCQIAMGSRDVVAQIAYGSGAGARYLAAELPWEAGRDDTTRATASISFAQSASVERERRERRAKTEPPHFIVVSLDNVQANRVGGYGYRRHPTTPTVDAIAAQGMLFERAYSSYPRTRVFLSSMLTGRLLPPFKEHEVPPSYRETSLTQLLGAKGYRTLVKGWFDADFSFRPDGYGVDTFIPPSADERAQVQPGLEHVPFAKTLRAVKAHFSKATQANEPVFVWLHFLRPHSAPPRFNTFLGNDELAFGTSLSDEYDEAIATADGYVAKIRTLAKDVLGSERPIYWVIMSDHGAGFSTREEATDFSMQRTVKERFVRVPLVIAGPGIGPGRSDVLVSSAIDTAATLLDLAGITPPASYDGTSLSPILFGYARPDGAPERAIHLRYYGHQAIVRGTNKLTKFRNTVSLVNVASDPEERTNLADRKPKLARELKSLVRAETARIEAGYEAR
jgi:arylsulfatase A-like enzyme